uniref:Putative endonuclease/reverse transcriptase n=1 Tax=Ixodes ricinus TaxID=34613 RepID=A0A6B0U653_IXORI
MGNNQSRTILFIPARLSLLGAKASVLAMPKHLPCQRLDHLTPPGLEAIFVEVFCKHGQLLLVSTYCSPSLREQSYALLQESLQRVDPSRYSAPFI